MRVYLDICCLNRPFDNQAQSRVRLESEAILAIVSLPETQVEFLRSPAHDLENDQNPHVERSNAIRAWLGELPVVTFEDAPLEQRIDELIAFGFKNFDAFHLACAEFQNADVFVTCDDRLLACAARNASSLNVRVSSVLDLTGELF